MIEQDKIIKIQEAIVEFFEKMTVEVSDIKISTSLMEKNYKDIASTDLKQNQEDGEENIVDVLDVDVEIDEPQVVIGQQGQTLFEIQRLLRAILSKKFESVFYLNLDVNGYKKKKIEYLKYLAKDSADQVIISNKEKALLPMSSYERRIVHAELSGRTDVITESRGDSFERHIVIKPK
jgi:spoIIIJ-associated protein